MILFRKIFCTHELDHTTHNTFLIQKIIAWFSTSDVMCRSSKFYIAIPEIMCQDSNVILKRSNRKLIHTSTRVRASLLVIKNLWSKVLHTFSKSNPWLCIILYIFHNTSNFLFFSRSSSLHWMISQFSFIFMVQKLVILTSKSISVHPK